MIIFIMKILKKKWKKELKKGYSIIKGRIIEKYSGKSKCILIIQNKNRFRLILNDNIDYLFWQKQLKTGDLIAILGLKIDGINEGKYEEVEVKNIRVIKTSLLKPEQTAIGISNRFNYDKEKKFFHTKMYNDELTIFRIEMRAKIFNLVREYLNKNKFIECNTPIITESFFGGGALPFETYVNYKHKACYLRANSEMALKLYIAGGMERVYEIGSYFRNCSIDKMSSVPYTAVEIYCTDISYDKMLSFAENLYTYILYNIRAYLKKECNEIKKISFMDFMRKQEYSNFSLDHLEKYFTEKNMPYNEENKYENINLLYRLFKENIIRGVEGPVIIYDMPSGISPLISKKKNDDLYLQRGFMIYKGYSIMEITHGSNDANEVVEELNYQLESLNSRQNDIRRNYDSFIHALKIGIPETSSITISIDRFISLIFDDNNIQDYFLFM